MRTRTMHYEKEEEIPDVVPTPPGKRWLIGVMIAVVVLSVGGFSYWKIFVQKKTLPPPTLEQAQIGEKVAFLDSRIQTIREGLSELGANGDTEKQRKLIEEAVARQNELMRLRPSLDGEDALRLNEWQARLDDINVSVWSGESRDLEEKSNQLIRAKQPVEAIDTLKQALALQQKINASFARQSLKNYSRESRLQQEVERLEAEPLTKILTEYTDKAKDAARAGRWNEAVQFYEQARSAQIQLNKDYARTRFADPLAVERFDAELANLGAAEVYDQLQTVLKQAAAATEARKGDDAKKLLDQAAELQRTINDQYSKSRFVSTELFEKIDVQRQSLRASKVFAEITALDQRSSQHLRRRELFQSQQLVTEALMKIEAITAQYPKAQGLDDTVKQRLNYLNLRQADLVQIQDQLYDRLAPLPTNEHIALLKTEVPQGLFMSVMNSNPSRNAGRFFAVDSVTYAEADEFCRRLGWALGVVVRLPDENEFRVATGNLKSAVANAWSYENSSGKSQPAGQKPANAAGFHDMIGNLAEWLAAGPGDTGILAGGSYADNFSEMQRLPLKPAVKAERLRTNGFRVVVEIDLAAPLPAAN